MWKNKLLLLLLDIIWKLYA